MSQGAGRAEGALGAQIQASPARITNLESQATRRKVGMVAAVVIGLVAAGAAVYCGLDAELSQNIEILASTSGAALLCLGLGVYCYHSNKTIQTTLTTTRNALAAIAGLAQNPEEVVAVMLQREGGVQGVSKDELQPILQAMNEENTIAVLNLLLEEQGNLALVKAGILALDFSKLEGKNRLLWKAYKKFAGDEEGKAAFLERMRGNIEHRYVGLILVVSRDAEGSSILTCGTSLGEDLLARAEALQDGAKNAYWRGLCRSLLCADRGKLDLVVECVKRVDNWSDDEVRRMSSTFYNARLNLLKSFYVALPNNHQRALILQPEVLAPDVVSSSSNTAKMKLAKAIFKAQEGVDAKLAWFRGLGGELQRAFIANLTPSPSPRAAGAASPEQNAFAAMMKTLLQQRTLEDMGFLGMYCAQRLRLAGGQSNNITLALQAVPIVGKKQQGLTTAVEEMQSLLGYPAFVQQLVDLDILNKLIQASQTKQVMNVLHAILKLGSVNERDDLKQIIQIFVRQQIDRLGAAGDGTLAALGQGADLAGVAAGAAAGKAAPLVAAAAGAAAPALQAAAQGVRGQLNEGVRDELPVLGQAANVLGRGLGWVAQQAAGALGNGVAAAGKYATKQVMGQVQSSGWINFKTYLHNNKFDIAVLEKAARALPEELVYPQQRAALFEGEEKKEE